MVALFERTHSDLVHRVSKMDDAAWNRRVQLSLNGKVAMEPRLGQFL
jgi:hypothetical protein